MRIETDTLAALTVGARRVASRWNATSTWDREDIAAEGLARALRARGAAATPNYVRYRTREAWRDALYGSVAPTIPRRDARRHALIRQGVVEASDAEAGLLAAMTPAAPVEAAHVVSSSAEDVVLERELDPPLRLTAALGILEVLRRFDAELCAEARRALARARTEHMRRSDERAGVYAASMHPKLAARLREEIRDCPQAVHVWIARAARIAVDLGYDPEAVATAASAMRCEWQQLRAAVQAQLAQLLELEVVDVPTAPQVAFARVPM